ncbi:hypothetical protein O5D80_006112 [Batrachochytrium dendrobatidis]|nr:hypothetical protein O5D80_006112 [Batrachochytrium dendrobatidis]
MGEYSPSINEKAVVSGLSSHDINTQAETMDMDMCFPFVLPDMNPAPSLTSTPNSSSRCAPLKSSNQPLSTLLGDATDPSQTALCSYIDVTSSSHKHSLHSSDTPISSSPSLSTHTEALSTLSHTTAVSAKENKSTSLDKPQSISPLKSGHGGTPNRKCNYCGATSTPMWRHGPGIYTNLCNSCGVKWRRGKILQTKQLRHPLCAPLKPQRRSTGNLPKPTVASDSVSAASTTPLLSEDPGTLSSAQTSTPSTPPVDDWESVSPLPQQPVVSRTASVGATPDSALPSRLRRTKHQRRASAPSKSLDCEGITELPETRVDSPCSMAELSPKENASKPNERLTRSSGTRHTVIPNASIRAKKNTLAEAAGDASPSPICPHTSLTMVEGAEQQFSNPNIAKQPDLSSVSTEASCSLLQQPFSLDSKLSNPDRASLLPIDYLTRSFVAISTMKTQRRRRPLPNQHLPSTPMSLSDMSTFSTHSLFSPTTELQSTCNVIQAVTPSLCEEPMSLMEDVVSTPLISQSEIKSEPDSIDMCQDAKRLSCTIIDSPLVDNSSYRDVARKKQKKQKLRRESVIKPPSPPESGSLSTTPSLFVATVPNTPALAEVAIPPSIESKMVSPTTSESSLNPSPSLQSDLQQKPASIKIRLPKLNFKTPTTLLSAEPSVNSKIGTCNDQPQNDTQTTNYLPTASAKSLRTHEFATLLKMVPKDKIEGFADILASGLDDSLKQAMIRGEQVHVSVMLLRQPTWQSLWDYARSFC